MIGVRHYYINIVHFAHFCIIAVSIADKRIEDDGSKDIKAPSYQTSAVAGDSLTTAGVTP